jgi:putative intracellular protease/amidase
MENNMALIKHFLQKSKFVLAIVAATFLLTPARSYAETKTAQSGQVKAELSYQPGENGTYKNHRFLKNSVKAVLTLKV